MKKIKYFMFVAFLLCTSSILAQNEKAKVCAIDYSDFVSEIYPKMKRPLIILFGSNYCRYSINQMKLLNQIVKSTDYYRDCRLNFPISVV